MYKLIVLLLAVYAGTLLIDMSDSSSFQSTLSVGRSSSRRDSISGDSFGSSGSVHSLLSEEYSFRSSSRDSSPSRSETPSHGDEPSDNDYSTILDEPGWSDLEGVDLELARSLKRIALLRRKNVEVREHFALENRSANRTENARPGHVESQAKARRLIYSAKLKQAAKFDGLLGSLYWTLAVSGNVYETHQRALASNTSKKGFGYHSFDNHVDRQIYSPHLLQLRADSDVLEDNPDTLWTIGKVEWRWQRAEGRTERNKEEFAPFIAGVNRLRTEHLREPTELPAPHDFGLYQNDSVHKGRGNGILLVFNTEAEVDLWRKLKTLPLFIGPAKCFLKEVRQRGALDKFYGVTLDTLPAKQVLISQADREVSDGWSCEPLHPTSEICKAFHRLRDDCDIDEPGVEAQDAGSTFVKQDCIVLSK